ncbi:MAG: IPT/TIG domain-containing protein [Acidobacteriia bacterium]|nr:IPT/TIG domain-containing protein [Terriglobia bacterium]
MKWKSYSRLRVQLFRIFSLILVTFLPGMAPHESAGAMQRSAATREQIDRILQRYDRVRMDTARVAQQVRDTGEFRIATPDQIFDVVLEPYDLRASGCVAEEELPGGARSELARAPAHTFRGTVPRLWDSEARFTVRDATLEGVILTPDEWYYIEPLRNFSPSSDPSEMVVYRRSDIRPEVLGVCGTTLAHRIGEARELVEPRMLAATSGVRAAQVATEADYEYVVACGGATEANATILDILNQVDGIYQSQLSISLQVVYQHVWSTPTDPYSSTAPSAMLSEFRDHWNANFYYVPFDLAHMWTGKNMDGSTIGIAYLSVVCEARSYSYGVSQRLTSSPGKYLLTAHEIGHNFGATHTEQASPAPTDCGNTIMNSTIGTGSTFCPYSRAEIAAHVASASSCLTSGPAAPSNLTAIAVSSSQVNLLWLDNSADETGFAVERKEGAGGIWSQVGTTAANVTSFSDTGLGTNTNYYYRVEATGAAADSAYSNEVSATTLSSPPTITGMAPSSGRAGTVVTITGTNLNGATTVKFNTSAAAGFTVVSPARITATVPAGATSGRISVTTPVGTGASSAVFTVSASRCDINGDGSVNVLDIQLLINSILGIPGSPTNCDINGDGVTNALDLQMLINVILGLTGCPG